MVERELIDSFVLAFDRALRTVFAPAASRRPVPGANFPEPDLDREQRRHAARLMRVNHSGEVCAQALYQAQAIVSRQVHVRDALEAAALEETEHLHWTERRIAELDGRKSLLNPLWYAGSLATAMVAGTFGDRWNLGFLAETERQVEAHLTDHLGRLPADDNRSHAVLAQMRIDEARHADAAVHLGAAELPQVVKFAMKFASRLMTRTAYWI